MKDASADSDALGDMAGGALICNEQYQALI